MPLLYKSYPLITASRFAIFKYHLERFLNFLSPISCHSCLAIHGHVAMSAIEYLSPARYFEFSKRIYQELDQRLAESKFLSGDQYTIADIATFPWIARHEWHDIGLSKFKNLARWYTEISAREAVKKGFSFMDKNETPPKP